MSAQALLRTEGLSLKFGGVIAADAIDFDLMPGERLAVVGQNGAGKTTFINICTGYLKADAGQVFFDGACLRAQIAGGHVDEGGLAGAVRADDGEELARHHVEVYPVRRLHAAEGQAQPARREEGCHAPRPRSRPESIPHSPPGAKRMTARSTPPRIICQASATAAAA